MSLCAQITIYSLRVHVTQVKRKDWEVGVEIVSKLVVMFYDRMGV
jgi:hypothetical protein